jgi:hypothetical protein
MASRRRTKQRKTRTITKFVRSKSSGKNFGIGGRKITNYLIGGAALSVVNKFLPTQFLGNYRLAGNMVLTGLIPGQKAIRDAGIAVGVSTAMNQFILPKVLGFSGMSNGNGAQRVQSQLNPNIFSQ